MNIVRKVLTCHECKGKFPAAEMIVYTTLTGKTSYNYCRTCYEERVSRDKFADKVCEIFGLAAPGARIWKDRETIQVKWGFTDETIIECLDYLYNVEKKRKLSESLTLITPDAMERMLRYKERHEIVKNNVQEQVAANVNTQQIVIKENLKNNKQKIDISLFE